jgi:rubrerythrin
MTELPATPPQGASVWERSLFTHLTEHVQNERVLLEAYVEAGRATNSKALAYLINLLIEDEQRHHRLFAELADSLKSEAELRREEPTVPRMDFDQVDRVALLETTDRLLANEKKDRHELKNLRREMRDVADTTLWGLLVELMERDTDKHIAILSFAKRHTTRR